jgi:site-specific DNA-methyltransferase (adenine-specific)
VIPATLEDLKVPVASLRLYHANPRRGDVAVIADSLRRHGQYRPIVVNRRTSEVLAGNHTLLGAIDLGWTDIAATFVDVDDETAARIVLIDNRASDLAVYDDSALVDLLRTLPDLGGTGFERADLEELLAGLNGRRSSEDTEPGAVPPTPVTAAGDLVVLGDHRLLCGDATDVATVARVLHGDEVELLLTDPPYGVSYVGGTADALTMTGDADDDQALEHLLETSLGVARFFAPAGAPAYVFHADTHGEIARRAFGAAGWDLKQVLVWVKQRFVLGRQDYQWQHEPVLYGWKPGAAHRWYGDYDKTTVLDDDVDPRKLSKAQLLEAVLAYAEQAHTSVLRHDRPTSSSAHPTMKPVGLIASLMENSSRAGGVVLDPFGGSGSTLIAAENLGRRARLVEIDPGYCDVIVDRWERHTGRTAERTPSAQTDEVHA